MRLDSGHFLIGWGVCEEENKWLSALMESHWEIPQGFPMCITTDTHTLSFSLSLFLSISHTHTHTHTHTHPSNIHTLIQVHTLPFKHPHTLPHTHTHTHTRNTHILYFHTNPSCPPGSSAHSDPEYHIIARNIRYT